MTITCLPSRSIRADPKLRRHLNREDKAFDLQEGRLNRIAMSFASPQNRYRVRRAIRWFELWQSRRVGGGYRLWRSLSSNPARSTSCAKSVQRFDGRIGLQHSFVSNFKYLSGVEGSQGFFVPSMLFGNAVGLVESRRGKLDDRPELAARVSKRARAGDILLEKTPFRLTDSFIPGHWGHVAIWAGTPEELRGTRDMGASRRAQASLGKSKRAAASSEALRSGEDDPFATVHEY